MQDTPFKSKEMERTLKVHRIDIKGRQRPQPCRDIDSALSALSCYFSRHALLPYSFATKGAMHPPPGTAQLDWPQRCAHAHSAPFLYTYALFSPL